ncbi:alpha/beta hydrolase family protein [Roseovarius sp.]|uniref:alpha/beta hydrolase family protein n=1 Tax=Roseovarius sp. TaxID=1486281 RepID=UPI003A974A8A
MPLPLSLFHLAAIFFLGLANMAQAQSPGPLNGQIFGAGNRALVVVVHGDVSKGGPATYHYDLAKQIAEQSKDVSVFALVRPGYTGKKGQNSPGSNTGRRDHYTKENNALVAKTIQNLAKSIGASKVIGIGHSGGAAQLGAIAGIYPGLLDSVILVSCPCNIPEWRAKRGKSAWTNSLSPHDHIAAMARGTRIFAVVGDKDTNTYPELSEAFVLAAKARGLPAAYVPVKGASHGFDQLQRTVEQLALKEIAK